MFMVMTDGKAIMYNSCVLYRTTTAYGKPIHTDQYVYWDSQPNRSARYCVLNTLTHRSRTILKLVGIHWNRTSG